MNQNPNQQQAFQQNPPAQDNAYQNQQFNPNYQPAYMQGQQQFPQFQYPMGGQMPQAQFGGQMPQAQVDPSGQQPKAQPNQQSQINQAAQGMPQPQPGNQQVAQGPMAYQQPGNFSGSYSPYGPPGFNPGMGGFQMPMAMPMGFNPYQPMAFPSLPPMSFQMPNSTIVGDNSKLQEKEKIIQRLNDEIDDYKKQVEDMQDQFERNKKRIEKKAADDIEELENQNSDLRHRITELENKIAQLQKQIQNNQQNFQKDKSVLEQQVQDLDNELEAARGQIYNLQTQKSQNNIQNQMIMPAFTNNDQSDRLKKELEEAKRKIKVLENKITALNTDSKSQIDTQIFELQQELEKTETARQEFLKENENLRKQIQMLKTENKVSNDSVFNLQNQLREQTNKYKQETKKTEDLQLNIKARDEQIQQLDLLFKQLQEQPVGRANADQQQELMKQFNLLQAKNQQQQELEKQKEEKLKKEMIIEQQRREERQRDQIQFDIQEKEKKRNQAKLIQQRFLQSHGQMDVCFLVDVTASMDPYKEQTRQCVSGSMNEIKTLTNRDTNFACVCYQDFAELKRNNQEYQQFNFTKNPAELQAWLQQVKCGGGGDAAEDINGGIKQICTKITWTSRFRIAILICDAPCHGAKYHEANVSDDHPTEDITAAIQELIKLEILFIGLNFKPYTTKMYSQIKQIFVDAKREELFMLVDMQNTPLQQIAQQMVKQIGQASQSATQTNNNSTKSKQQAQDEKKVKDGAMEALCKQGKFMDFEKQVEIVYVKFTVFRTEIKADSLERNLKTIQNIQTQYDYQNTQEGFWDCIRTKAPFAYGMMKAVFLMKKKSNLKDELYVIKTPLSGRPYKTMDEALKECKSHLICQQLMKKFYRDLQGGLQQKNIFKKYQEVVYSDFLILQETDTAFWIAERFFKGEFVKYNNNYGFISDSQDPLNQIAQAFTYYTYFISDFNYMINDVQGVSTYFTDPAVNTKTGDFDDTDMGENGQAMFIANFSDHKKKICSEILQILDIFDNDQQVKQPVFVPNKK